MFAEGSCIRCLLPTLDFIRLLIILLPFYTGMELTMFSHAELPNELGYSSMTARDPFTTSFVPGLSPTLPALILPATGPALSHHSLPVAVRG